MGLTKLRQAAYRELEPTAWPGKGLSPVNRVLVLLIILAVIEAVIDTEPSVAVGRDWFFDRVEFGFGVIFTVEYLVRAWVARDNPRFQKYRFPRLHYLFTPLAIIDFLAIVPALFAFGGAPSLVLRFFRVLRMFRLAKLGRTSKAVVLIREAIVSKANEFGLIFGMLAVSVLIAGSLLYWAEGEAQPDKFGSIPRAMWWAVMTLTTVGYGDTYPVTTLGKVLAGVIAVLGVMLIALPTGLFAASFTEAMERERFEHERRQAVAKERAAKKNELGAFGGRRSTRK